MSEVSEENTSTNEASGEQIGTTGGRTQFSKPAVGDDYVYVGGLGAEVRCYPRGSTDGDSVWTFTREGSLADSSPILDEQRGQLYIGSGSGNLYAIDAETGEQSWVYETETGSAITATPVLNSGDVYVGTNDGTLLRVDANSGNKKKQAQLDAGIYGQPLVHKRRVYVLTETGTIHARYAQSFNEDWKRETGGDGVRSAPIGVEGAIYIATDAVYKLRSRSGDIEWQRRYGGHAGSTPMYDSRLYVGDADGTLHAFDPENGDTLWTYDAGAPVTSTPVRETGRVLVGTRDGTFHSINITDETDIVTDTVADRRPSPPVVADGDLYVTAENDSGGALVQLDRETLRLKPLPTISSVDQTGKTDNGDPVFEVQGRNFGSKDQGPAVLYDFVNETYENGTLNPFNGTFYDNEQDLHTAYPERDRIYDGMSIPEEEQNEYGVSRQDKSPAQYISDESEQPHRHDGVDAHYRLRNGSFIGLPMAYGGNHESTDPDMERRYERPENENQIYVAWWLRPEFGLQSHAVFQPASFEGDIDFGDSKRDRGERFVIPEGGAGGIDVDGWVIGIRDGTGTSPNDDGRVEVEFDTRSNVNRIAGKTLVGQKTGAKIDIPEDEDTADIERFVSPNKLLRIWGSGGRTISMAWGVNVVKLEESVWHSFEPNPQEWNLLETVIDVETGFLEAWVNFEKCAEFTFDPKDVETDNSPTMQLLGMHTGTFGFNTFRISEVYQDKSAQRVVIADAETLAEATHYELQRPTEWSNDRLRFALSDGQLPTDQQLYAFVFDDQNQVNKQGHPITLSTQEVN